MDHRREPTRLSEVKGIKNSLEKAKIDNDNCQIWTGDFNALTKEDYKPEEWTEITNVRQKNSWELPKTELTSQVQHTYIYHSSEKRDFCLLKSSSNMLQNLAYFIYTKTQS